jgi:hypothetical protein
MNSHPLAVILREFIPLPDSVISQIILFNSHPIADIVRQLEKTDYGVWGNFIKITIKNAKVSKNILEYNRVVLRIITQEKI